ncbi:MAG TPA: Hpt domain-containing protein [Rhizobiaceae bacterium]|nr:Hpt domain-containing protein [Rhizobiaceae bacterium]
MAHRGRGPVAFERPGGKPGEVWHACPIDLTHLARQTLGDRKVQQEVLALFVQQALSVRDQLGQAGLEERLRLAHGLKGSARGVGAFDIADCVAQIETNPDDDQAVERLSRLIDAVRDFVASIRR